MTRLAICGFPRSGTTMLQQMLYTTAVNFSVIPTEHPYHKVLGRDYVITKRPFDVGSVPKMLESGTEPILSIRDPRSVLTSKHISAPGRYFIDYDAICFTPHGQFKGKRHRGSFMWTWKHLKPLLYAGHVVVRYEKLIADPEHVQKMLGERFGIEYGGVFSDFWHTCHNFSALNGVRPVDTTNVDRWRRPEHADRIRSLFQSHPDLFDILCELGYEKDRSWFDHYK